MRARAGARGETLAEGAEHGGETASAPWRAVCQDGSTPQLESEMR